MFTTQNENDFDIVRRVLDQWMCCSLNWLGIYEKSTKITESVAGLKPLPWQRKKLISMRKVEQHEIYS